MKKTRNGQMITKQVVISTEKLKLFIDIGPAQRLFMIERLPILLIIRFVTFLDNHLTIIIGEKFPGCGSAHLRNIFNAEFISELFEPHVCSLFYNVTTVINMMTSHPLFSLTVDFLGGRVVKVIKSDEKTSRLEVQSLILECVLALARQSKGLPSAGLES